MASSAPATLTDADIDRLSGPAPLSDADIAAHDRTAQSPEHPSYWHELWQQSGIPGVVEGLTSHPAATVASALGSLLSVVNPGLDPVPEGGHVSVTQPSQIQQASDIADRGPAAIGAAATLGALPLAAKLIPGATRAAASVPGKIANLAAEPGIADAVGVISPRAGNALKLVGRGKKAIDAFNAGRAEAAAAAIPAEDTTLLDGVAQGFKYKDFASAPPDIQATIRSLAGRLDQSTAGPPPGPRPAWRDNLRPTPPPAPDAAITPDQVTPAPQPAQPAGLLPAAPSRVIDLPAPTFDPANDASSVRAVTPGRGTARDPRTGRMKRVYSGSDQQLTSAAPASEGVQPPPELLERLNATPEPAAPVSNDPAAAQPGPVTPPAEALQQLNAGVSNGRTNGRLSRAAAQDYDAATIARRTKSAEEMAQFIARDPSQAQGILDLLENPEPLPDNPTTADLDRLHTLRDNQWTALKRLVKQDQLSQVERAGGTVKQSEVMNLKNTSVPNPVTRRMVVQRVQEILQQNAAKPAAVPPPAATPRTGMGAMKRYRTDYNPAALSDSEIQAINR